MDVRDTLLLTLQSPWYNQIIDKATPALLKIVIRENEETNALKIREISKAQKLRSSSYYRYFEEP